MDLEQYRSITGAQLKERRNQADLTLDELAQESGVHVRTLVRWEADQVKPHGGNLRKVIRVLERVESGEHRLSKERPKRTISAVVLRIVLETKLEYVNVAALPYLQRVFEECQKTGVEFTPQLACALLNAFKPSTT